MQRSLKSGASHIYPKVDYPASNHHELNTYQVFGRISTYVLKGKREYREPSNARLHCEKKSIAPASVHIPVPIVLINQDIPDEYHQDLLEPSECTLKKNNKSSNQKKIISSVHRFIRQYTPKKNMFTPQRDIIEDTITEYRQIINPLPQKVVKNILRKGIFTSTNKARNSCRKNLDNKNRHRSKVKNNFKNIIFDFEALSII